MFPVSISPLGCVFPAQSSGYAISRGSTRTDLNVCSLIQINNPVYSSTICTDDITKQLLFHRDHVSQTGKPSQPAAVTIWQVVIEPDTCRKSPTPRPRWWRQRSNYFSSRKSRRTYLNIRYNYQHTCAWKTWVMYTCIRFDSSENKCTAKQMFRS